MSELVSRRNFLIGAGVVGAGLAVSHFGGYESIFHSGPAEAQSHLRPDADSAHSGIEEPAPLAETGLSETSTTVESTIETTASSNPFNNEVDGISLSDTLFNMPGTDKAMTQAEINRRLNMVKSLGATAIRFDFDGSVIQPEEVGKYNWSRHDRIMKAAHKRGLGVLATVTLWPESGQETACQGKPSCPPEDLNQFADFAGAIAARYKNLGLRKFEIWNEANIQAGGADPVRYAQMFNLARAAITEANPEAVVAIGAMAGVASDGNRLGPADFLDGVLTAGIGGFAAIAFNAYSYPANPDNNIYWNPFAQIEGPLDKKPAGSKIRTLYEVMKAHGVEAAPILVTEFGSSTLRTGEKFQETAYNQVLTRKFKHVKVPGRYAYTLMDKPGNTAFDKFGMLNLKGKAKPAAAAFKNHAVALKKKGSRALSNIVA